VGSQLVAAPRALGVRASLKLFNNFNDMHGHPPVLFDPPGVYPLFLGNPYRPEMGPTTDAPAIV
jgi:hypothetical protein